MDKLWGQPSTGGQWHYGNGTGRSALNIHDMTKGPDIGCRATCIPPFPSGGRATPSIIKTKMLFTDSITGNAYPIYYCNITERYFIKLDKYLWEVKYMRIFENERRRWVQAGEIFPSEKGA